MPIFLSRSLLLFVLFFHCTPIIGQTFDAKELKDAIFKKNTSDITPEFISSVKLNAEQLLEIQECLQLKRTVDSVFLIVDEKHMYAECAKSYSDYTKALNSYEYAKKFVKLYKKSYENYPGDYNRKNYEEIVESQNKNIDQMRKASKEYKDCASRNEVIYDPILNRFYDLSFKYHDFFVNAWESRE